MLYQLILSVVLLFGTASAYAALPELPRVYVDTTIPSTSVTKTVCASGCDYTNDKLQQAIDDAQLGTTITLQPGVTYTPLHDWGFILKNKTSGSGWIIIKSANTDSALPPPGTRLTPDYASVMPKIARSSGGLYALSCEPTAHHYRIIGVEFMNTGNVDAWIAGAAFVNCSSALETSLAMQSHHILFDRVYIHGPSAGGSVGVKFGIVFGGQHEGVIDSTIEDITYSSDAITVANWAGAGPFVIKNNALASSGENIAFGGADTQIANLIPSDIEIRNNYVYKPLKWRDDPAYTSGPNRILTKNLFETKNSQRVLMDGNVFENNWPSAQPGFALTFSPRQGNSKSTQPWTVVQDITVTNNTIKGTANGIALSGQDPGMTASGEPPTSLGGRYLIKNNLFLNNGGYAGTGIMFQLGNGAFDVTIQHNTVASYAAAPVGTTLMFGYGPANGDLTTMQRFVLQDNIFLARNYPFFAASGGACYAQYLGIATPGYVWTNNVFAGPWPTPVGCDSSSSPQGNGNAYPAGESSIGYVNPAGGNYSLATGSPYKNAASDGKDIGVNWPALTAAQGTPTTTSPASTPAPTPPAPAPTPPAPAPTPNTPAPTPNTPPKPTTAPAPIPPAPVKTPPVPAPTTTVPPPTPTVPAQRTTVPAPTATAPALTITASAPTPTAPALTITASVPTPTAPALTITASAPMSTAPAPTITASAPTPTAPALTITASVPTPISLAPAPTTSAAPSGNSAEPECSQEQRRSWWKIRPWWKIWSLFQRCG